MCSYLLCGVKHGVEFRPSTHNARTGRNVENRGSDTDFSLATLLCAEYNVLLQADFFLNHAIREIVFFENTYF